jgi:type IV pilus assembly protein PilC
MQKYEFRGFRETGREVTGTIEAPSREGVIDRLREDGITPTHIKTVRAGVLQKQISLSNIRPISRRQLTIFTHQLATMLSAGVPLNNALVTLAAASEDARIKVVTADMAQSVENGSTFAEAIGRHPEVFDDLYQHLVQAGEESGRLDYTLFRLVESMERLERLKRKLRKAFTYPAVILAATTAVVLFMVAFVIPRYVSIFDQLGSGLPAPTRMIVALSEVIRPVDGGLLPVKPLLGLVLLVGIAVLGYLMSFKRDLSSNWTLIITIGLLFGGFYAIATLDVPASVGQASANVAMMFRFVLFGAIGFAAYRAFKAITSTPAGRYSWDKFKLRIPGIGVVIGKVALARFATTLSILYTAGVDIRRALEFVQPSTGNAVLEKGVANVRRKINSGETLAGAFRNEAVFPPIMIQMISIAEETSGLSEQLEKIAIYYEGDVDDVIDNIDTVIAPIMTVFMGVVVGLVIIALYLPVTSLIQDFSELIF